MQIGHEKEEEIVRGRKRGGREGQTEGETDNNLRTLLFSCALMTDALRMHTDLSIAHSLPSGTEAPRHGQMRLMRLTSPYFTLYLTDIEGPQTHGWFVNTGSKLHAHLRTKAVCTHIGMHPWISMLSQRSQVCVRERE